MTKETFKNIVPFVFNISILNQPINNMMLIILLKNGEHKISYINEINELYFSNLLDGMSW